MQEQEARQYFIHLNPIMPRWANLDGACYEDFPERIINASGLEYSNLVRGN